MPETPRPAITIIVPCHDCGRFLVPAIESALAQEGPFDLAEVIIVDDRSSDPVTLAALDDLRRRPRVTVMANTGRRGAAATRNVGIRAARTEWIAFLDCDDLLPHDSLRHRVEALAMFPDAQWIGGNWRSIDADGALIPCHEDKPVKGRGVDDPPRGEEYGFVEQAFVTDRPIRLARPVEVFIRRSISLTSTHLVKAALLREAGLYDEDLRTMEDRHLYVRLARLADFVFVPRVLFLYRQHGPATSADEDAMLRGRMAMFSKLAADPAFAAHRPLLERRYFAMCMNRAFGARKARRRGRAVSASLTALRARPASGEAWKCLVAGALGL